MDYLRFTYSHKYFAHIVFVVIILIILVYISKAQKRELRTDGSQPSKDGNGSLYYRSRPGPADSVETILQRIHWTSTLHKRTANWQRAFITATIITVIIVFVLFFGQFGAEKGRNMPSAVLIISVFIIILIVTYFVPNFNYTHGDAFSDYNLRQSAKLIADKLNLKVNLKAEPPAPTVDAPDRVDVMA